LAFPFARAPFDRPRRRAGWFNILRMAAAALRWRFLGRGMSQYRDCEEKNERQCR
jgi:hypothetical protein